ncbi:diaminopropionate ammonia-lyase [Oscillospiraceae bacterium HV4-5-C5C]|nr:diaminopropionate ammonia-lyase [Oscillospiraceae bacterium HV4-5-C5C]
MTTIKWTANRMPETADNNLRLLDKSSIEAARRFHQSFPQYQPTPLVRLNHLATYLGVKDLFVKDESKRFGLNAFKVLGGSYAIARYVAQRLNCPIEDITYDAMRSPELQQKLGQVTFYTATDGNHGRGVAWAARQLGQKAVVLMPKGSTKTRFDNIKAEGAEVTIEELNYDDCVRKANGLAQANPDGVMVQDTAWDGYEEIPTWIMQGYGTMALEAFEQLKTEGVERPTHIFVQAGVGSLAGAVQGCFANLYPGDCPITTVVEARAADCLYRSAEAADGQIRMVSGDLITIMAGLACGEPNTISFDILKNNTAFFASAEDKVAADGMRVLGAPIVGDQRVISGESGAVPLGLVFTILTSPEYEDFRQALNLNQDSRILCFSTEGDTDPENYKKIVWRSEQ